VRFRGRRLTPSAGDSVIVLEEKSAGTSAKMPGHARAPERVVRPLRENDARTEPTGRRADQHLRN
jgi:hypothetical protein